MCGLFSVLRLGQEAPKLEDANLTAPIEALQHRGPDHFGFQVSRDGQCAMAHARLSIIDLDGGAQPFYYASDDICLIVNGEFYDFEQIRESLSNQGHRFQSRSDSEIALHLYRQYGLDFVHHLRGEFALILYDGKEKRLIAVRDRFGIKPLVYAMDYRCHELIIASEAKAIIKHGFAAQWDLNAYAQATQMQYIPTDRTVFKGIYQLEPGMMLIHDQSAGLTLKRYWDLDYPETEYKAECGEEVDVQRSVHDLIVDAVRVRMHADVPVCAHLSGGIDSASIAGIAAQVSQEPLHCFTVSFPNHEGYDELHLAQEQAKHIGAHLHVVEVSLEDMIEKIDDAVYFSEGLSVNGHLAGKYMLSAAIAQSGFKVTLSGEGSDEVFGGYPHFKEDVMRQPHFADSVSDHVQKLYAQNDKLAGLFLSDGASLDASVLEKHLGFLPSFIKAKASLGFKMQSLLRDDYKVDALRDHNSFDQIAAHFDVKTNLSGRDVLDQSSYLWTKLTLAGYILKTLGDGCEMAHSLEGRVPYLDHKLFEYVRQIPSHYKIRLTQKGELVEKYILRQAVRPYVTQTLYNRQKHPFIAPPVSAGFDILHEKLGDLLHSDIMNQQPFYDPRKVQEWFARLRQSDVKKQLAQEPIMMMILTTLSLHKQFRLGA